MTRSLLQQERHALAHQSEEVGVDLPAITDGATAVQTAIHEPPPIDVKVDRVFVAR